MTALQMLQAIGFVRIGRWYLEGERLSFHLDSHGQRAQVSMRLSPARQCSIPERLSRRCHTG